MRVLLLQCVLGASGACAALHDLGFVLGSPVVDMVGMSNDARDDMVLQELAKSVGPEGRKQVPLQALRQLREGFVWDRKHSDRGRSFEVTFVGIVVPLVAQVKIIGETSAL